MLDYVDWRVDGQRNDKRIPVFIKPDAKTDPFCLMAATTFWWRINGLKGIVTVPEGFCFSPSASNAFRRFLYRNDSGSAIAKSLIHDYLWEQARKLEAEEKLCEAWNLRKLSNKVWAIMLPEDFVSFTCGRAGIALGALLNTFIQWVKGFRNVIK